METLSQHPDLWNMKPELESRKETMVIGTHELSPEPKASLWSELSGRPVHEASSTPVNELPITPQ